MPQILFQGIHHAKNKSLLIMEQFAVYLDLASNVRREREQGGDGLFRGCSDKEVGKDPQNKYLKVIWKIKFSKEPCLQFCQRENLLGESR